jgi:hypothetical protein
MGKCAHIAEAEVTQMPKNICNVLIINLAIGLLAVTIPQVHFAQSPSSKEASTLTNSKVAWSSLPASKQQNVPTPAQDISLITALFALPLVVTGYLFYKCRMLVHKFPSF